MTTSNVRSSPDALTVFTNSAVCSDDNLPFRSRASCSLNCFRASFIPLMGSYLLGYTPVWKHVALSVLLTPVAVLVAGSVIAEVAPFQKVTVADTALPLTAVTFASSPNGVDVGPPLY